MSSQPDWKGFSKGSIPSFDKMPSIKNTKDSTHQLHSKKQGLSRGRDHKVNKVNHMPTQIKTNIAKEIDEVFSVFTTFREKNIPKLKQLEIDISHSGTTNHVSDMRIYNAEYFDKLLSDFQQYLKDVRGQFDESSTAMWGHSSPGVASVESKSSSTKSQKTEREMITKSTKKSKSPHLPKLPTSTVNMRSPNGYSSGAQVGQRVTVQNTTQKLDSSKLLEENAKFQRELKALQQENDTLKTRLSEEISQNIVTDHDLEDVSQANRPLALRDRYEGICSSQWMDAKDHLDAKFSQETLEHLRFKLLCAVYEQGYTWAKSMRDQLLDRIYILLENPLQSNNPTAHHGNKVDLNTSTAVLPRLLKNSVCEYLLSRSENIKVEYGPEAVTKEVIDRVWRDEAKKTVSQTEWKAISKHLKESHSSVAYVSAVCKLCWAMVVQHVPMHFFTEGVGRPFNPTFQKPFYNCDVNKLDNAVKYYIHPALYHGDKLLQQGLVFTLPQQ